MPGILKNKKERNKKGTTEDLGFSMSDIDNVG